MRLSPFFTAYGGSRFVCKQSNSNERESTPPPLPCTKYENMKINHPPPKQKNLYIHRIFFTFFSRIAYFICICFVEEITGWFWVLGAVGFIGYWIGY